LPGFIEPTGGMEPLDEGIADALAAVGPVACHVDRFGFIAEGDLHAAPAVDGFKRRPRLALLGGVKHPQHRRTGFGFQLDPLLVLADSPWSLVVGRGDEHCAVGVVDLLQPGFTFFTFAGARAFGHLGAGAGLPFVVVVPPPDVVF